MPRRCPVALAAVLAFALPAPALAAAPAVPPLHLPGDATASAARVDRSTWIVGARPGAAGARVARAFGAAHIGPEGTGGYLVARSRARAFVAALRARGILAFAEPNALRRRSAMPADPLDVANRWRDRVVDPRLTPPRVTSRSPLIALVDATAATSHPDLKPNVKRIGSLPVRNLHGTATASVAAAPANGVGLSGVWPGARAVNVALDETISCADSANGIAKAITAGASVINMSYGADELCFDEFIALERAVGRDIVPVAAAGNEFAEGNPLEYPASLPHVVTVGSVGAADKPSFFSNKSTALDVAAPGEGIPAAVPPALDPDGTKDGYAALSGTSFAAPMVSAAIAWVRAERPGLRGDQAADLIRYNARDVGDEGYDVATGFGILDVGRARDAAAGPHDPAEPNDIAALVDPRYFSGSTLFFRGGRARAV